MLPTCPSPDGQALMVLSGGDAPPPRRPAARSPATDSGRRFEVLEREKGVVRLGSSGADMRELSDDAIDRAVAALDRFRQVAAVHDAPITAVATSAVREADNRDVFIDRAW